MSKFATLSARERAALAGLAAMKPVKEISHDLSCMPYEVADLVSSARSKLNARSIAEAVTIYLLGESRSVDACADEDAGEDSFPLAAHGRPKEVLNAVVGIGETNLLTSNACAGAARAGGAGRAFAVVASKVRAFVRRSIGQMDQDSEKHAALVEETTAAVDSLRQEAESIAHSVERLQMSGAQSQAALAKFCHQRADGLTHQISPALKTVAVSGGSLVQKLAEEPDQESWDEF